MNCSQIESLESRVLLASIQGAISEHKEHFIEWKGKQAEVAQGEWILSTRAGVSSLASRIQQAGEEVGLSLKLKRSLTLSGLSLIDAPKSTSYQALRRALSSLAGFKYVEPNFVVHADQSPNDTRFGELWGLHNTGQSGGTVDADIDAPDAWDIATGNGSVVVGVIDTGVDYNHSDLSANMWRNPGETPSDGIDNDGNGFIDDVYGWDFYNNDSNPFDDNEHGTHVAGTIAAVGNNGTGVVGVNWNAKIMALKFLNYNGSGYTDGAISAVNYATMMRNRGVNIRVTSNSWGGGGFSQALADAIAASGDAGMLFVAAAGNDGASTDRGPHYPSTYDLPNIISVAATDRSDQIAYFSNFGTTTVDLGAPGVDIISTTPGNTYKSFNGTSMATPHVSGVAALALSIDPTASYQRIRNAIFAGTDRIASMTGTTGTSGRLNAFNTLRLISATEPTIAFGAGDSTLAEPHNSGSFLVHRFGDTSSALVVPFTIGGTASVGVDYNLSATAFTIPAGAASATITVTPLPDGSVEGPETIQLMLLAGAGYALGDSRTMPLLLKEAPPNNNFASATPIPSLPATLTGTNIDADSEPDEPIHAGVGGGASVWWSFTAASSGFVNVSTAGSNFDTALAVYTGSSMPTLALVASNDDSGGLTSAVTFATVAATTYRIAVDGYSGAVGNIRLNVAALVPPGNDAFASAAPLTGTGVAATGNTSSASKEPGEPNHAGNPGGKSIWWRWTAPSSGPIIVNTAGSNFDTLLAVYTGSSVSSLTSIGANDDAGGTTSSVAFNAVAATTYCIAVDGYAGASGSVSLHLLIAIPPSNDAFAAATGIFGGSLSVSGSNVAATKEIGEPNHAGVVGGHSVWWSWTAGDSGSTTISTQGSTFDTVLAVYTGSSVSSLTLVASNDDWVGLTSAVTFNAVAGTSYRIAVDGYGGAVGTISLNLQGIFVPVTWDGGGDGWNWTDPLNWSSNAVPGPNEDVVINLAANPTIQLNSYSQPIRSLSCSENLTIGGGTLTVAQPSSVGGTFTLLSGTLGGDGSFTLSGSSNTWSGGTIEGAGALIISGGATLSISGGAARTSNKPLQINGKAKLLPDGNTTLVLKSLAMGVSGVLDLGNNNAVIDYTGSSPIGTIQALVAGGYAGGTWTGAGINSSAAAATPNRAVGFGEATDIGAGSSFAGAPIDSTSILLRYTLLGDATMDRSVNVADLGILASNWQASPRAWSQGNFDFDNDVDVTDLGILASNWQQSLVGTSPSKPARSGPGVPPRETISLRDSIVAGTNLKNRWGLITAIDELS